LREWRTRRASMQALDCSNRPNCGHLQPSANGRSGCAVIGLRSRRVDFDDDWINGVAGASRRVAQGDSYFSLPTDLATELRSRHEFVEGAGYAAEMKGSHERVSVCHRPAADEDAAYVLVIGEGCGDLFDRVLGRVVFALSAHSDSVWVSRWSPDIEPAGA
jgi:hypothetical protein